MICSKCSHGLEIIPAHCQCFICGYPVLNASISTTVKENIRCGDCVDIKPAKQRIFLRSCCVYSQIAKKIVVDFKYNDRTENVNIISANIAYKIQEILSDFQISDLSQCAFVVVPMHFMSYFNRMFNQSTTICNHLTRVFPKFKLYDKLLLKIKRTKKQSSLSFNERKKNLKNSININENINLDSGIKYFFLIDDVITTRNTMNLCASILKKHYKSTKIFGVSFARTLI